jgi:hypothetical protein
VIAAGLHRHVDPRPIENQHAANARRVPQRIVDRRFHAHRFAAPRNAVGGEQNLRARVGEPRCERFGSIAGKGRDGDRADVGDREQSDRGLGDERHENADRIAPLDAQLAQRSAEAGNLIAQRGERVGPHAAVFAFPHECRIGAAAGVDVAIQAVGGGVEARAGEPGGERLTAREIHDPFPGRVPTQVEGPHDALVKAREIGGHGGQERRVVGDAARAQERGEIRLFDVTGRGDPAVDADRERAHGVSLRLPGPAGFSAKSKPA